MRRLTLGLLPLLAISLASAQSISEVENAASGLIQGLPNSGIAQGAIFVVKGSNLGPSPIVIATNAFQDTNLGGTSVSVTVGSTTVNALMYYTSATQVAALLPSTTPVGSGTITVTYNGNPSSAVPVSVVQNNLGIFTVSQNGQGIGIVTYADYSLVSSVPGTGALGGGGPDTYGGAANPGDTLILWATGLGPISGSDAAKAGLGVNMPSIPLKLWLGGVAANVTYQGRSGCCIGEDQIVFTVPANVPTGCAVSLAVQIGTQVSNYTVIPVASSGRSCAPQNAGFSGDAGQALSSSSGPINYGFLSFARTIASETTSGTNYQDTALGNFAQISVSAANQPNVLSSLDIPAMGTCTTTNSNASAPPLFSVITGLDAGAITVSGPSPDFPVILKEQRGTGQPTAYTGLLSATGVYFGGGAYSVTAAGGADIGKFTSAFTITQTPTWQSSDQFRLSTGITRANGVTINWVNGSSAYWVEITGSAFGTAVDTGANVTASFSCWVPSAANTFTVPASVLLTLPGGVESEIDFRPTLVPFRLSPSGLDAGFLLFQYQTSYFTALN